MAGWPGFFVSLEGVDGSGKSTQVAALVAALRSRHVDVMAVRPDGTPLGEILHAFVLQQQRDTPLHPWTEALLFNAERAQLLQETVLPALQRGMVVVADRFADSTLAYQGGGRGVPSDALLRLHRDACADVWPDLTVYLRLPLRVAIRRQRAQQLPLDRFETAPEDFHAAVLRAFDSIAAANPDRVVCMDADRPARDVSTDIERLVLQRLPSRSGVPAAHGSRPS